MSYKPASSNACPFLFSPSPLPSPQCGSCDGATGYSSTANAPTCSPVTLCDVGFGQVAPPTPVSNRNCQACTVGFTYSNTVDDTACKSVTSCTAGQEETAAPTVSTNR